MDRGTCKRRLEGIERDCPVATGAGEFSPMIRWIHIRDGLEATIGMVPPAERVLVARLIECWAHACFRVEECEAKEPPPWVLPY